MGTEFFWFYDIAIVGILIGVMFKCGRKGFVATLLGLISLVVSFIAAFILSAPIADGIYSNIVEKPLEQSITDSLADIMSESTTESLAKIDTTKITVNGKALGELDLTPDSAGKINLDLSSLDYSKTGMADADLSMFGIKKEETDYTKIDSGSVQITEAELKDNSIGKIIFANTLAVKVQDGGNGLLTTIDNISKLVSDTLPTVMSDGLTTSLATDDKSLVKDFVMIMLNTNSKDIGRAVLTNFVAPLILVPIRVIAFMILFVILMILFALVIRFTKLINKIPVLGKLNELLGAVLGIVEAAIVILIVALVIQLFVTITGNSIMVLNEMTIEKTFFFRYIYNFEFLNMLK